MSDGKTKGGTTASRAGALQSSVNILLHTHYAIRLWEGRKRDASNEIGAKKRGLKSLVCRRPLRDPVMLQETQQQIILTPTWYC